MFELLKGTKMDFMSKKIYTFVISGIFSLLGIFAIVQIGLGRANLGVDFAGGTAVQIKFAQTVKLQDVRKALDEGGLKDFDLQDLPTENKILVRVKKQEEKLGGFSEKINQILLQKFSDKKPVIDSVTEIGPKVGSRLKKDAMWAVIIATIGILVYVAWRFQFRFGVGATIATFHDVLAVLGIFYISGKEMNLIFLSALLTIAGYSLTDTVVVFDRIRENIKKMLKEPIEVIVNKSINEVLSRTIVTSLTTFLAAFALFLFGGEVIHDFALAMLIGIAIGTYSSIFVASPVVVLLGRKRGPKKVA
ncbi:protein translocase subunit SecF [Dissulfurispira thermophila]|uniref:Protein-export membrane protein SecF n=2 Tax=root TaxID=1 RepID=A0A7G1H429_9BACT|nr:protein translocase subunit SecF [Dissulfurispira thermophila]BCB96939.1 protein translocase subunit SecF [Dissulfurispira thermophila]